MKLKKKLKKKVKETPVKKEVAQEKTLETGNKKYGSLRDVIDYTLPLTFFFSGVENESFFDVLYEDMGIRNYLMSYVYAKGKGASKLKKHHDMRLFIDSGAYTFLTDPSRCEGYTVEDWENYIVNYLDWARKHQENIFALADLDLQEMVGEDVVRGWRQKYFEPFMLETGVPVCFIYHNEGLDVWEQMCQRYPYVGFPLYEDMTGGGGDTIREMFRIAEKYNTLVQGMASTNTKVLSNYPFYTVDSTSWQAGLRYGEISVWDGARMRRFKKGDFERRAFPLIDTYDMKFDYDLILEDNYDEMIKVNAYAFIQAEKVVRERLKSKMYWLKAKSILRNDLSQVNFPSAEWLRDPQEADFSKYAKELNLNPNFEQLSDLIYDVTVLCNRDKEEYRDLYEWYLNDEQDDLVSSMHDLYVNKIAPTKESKLDDLFSVFKECVLGFSDKLLHLGTDFDRIVKEREQYIEEGEEVIELTKEEVEKEIRGLLPVPGDEETEITSLDSEIFSNLGIVPQFDENRKLVKGQKILRKPKQIYSSRFPKFACDTCYAANKCPEYKAGYVCAYHKLFTQFKTRNMSDVILAMQGMVDHNLARMQKEMMMEVLTGVHNDSVSSLIDQNTKLLGNLQQLYDSGSKEILRQSRVVRADGSVEDTMSVSNPQSGGILEKLFGGMAEEDEKRRRVKNKKKKKKKKVIKPKKKTRRETIIDVEPIED